MIDYKKLIHKVLLMLGIRKYSSKQQRIMSIANGKHISKKNESSDYNSVIFFTTHKCASNYVKELINYIESNYRYKTFDYGKLVGGLADELNINGQVEDFLNINHEELFVLNGEIYGPQRMPLNFNGLEKFKSIFFLRDPRDVLISSYYSFGYSHPEPSSENLKTIHQLKRKHIQNTSIDEYVIDFAKSWILPIYADYSNLYSNAENSLFLNYDLFINDTKKFLVSIFSFLDLKINDSDIDKLVKKASPISKNINIENHKRSGRSRQWEHELSEDTQKALTLLLNPILKEWNFKL